MNRIKICHFTSAHQWNDVRIFLKECRTLADAGNDVYLVHAGNKNEVVDGVRLVGIGHLEKTRINRMLGTAKAIYLKALTCDADIYHFHDPELLCFVDSLKVKRKKVVYDVHEDVPRQILGKYWIPKIFRSVVSRIFEAYENGQAQKVDLIIAATPHIKKRFLAINSNTVDVCNFPIRAEFISAESVRVKYRVCYIGALTKIRGIKEIVQAIEGTKVELHLAGKFSPESFRNELMQLKGWANVRERGFLTRSEVAELVSTSEIGLVTLYPQINYLDSLPIKMFEYMLAGLPVLASNFPLWEEILTINKCGVTVDPQSPDAIKNTMLKLLESPSLLSAMGQAGKQAALRSYTWEFEAEKLIQCYRSISLDL